jgi:DNA-binding Lrp family transcriptional regulator
MGGETMKRGILLTERDFRLLRDLYDSTLLSFAQIRDRYFAGLANPTIRNRLSRLKGEKLIRTQEVGVVLHHQRERRIGVVYQITSKAIDILKQRYPNALFREGPVPLATANLVHELLLSDTLLALKKRFTGSPIVHGKLVPVAGSHEKRVPDAVVLGHQGREQMAIELELSAKSERRYREIILSYRLNPRYSHVLYVTAQKAIAEKIRNQISHAPVPGMGTPETGKFYFVELERLITCPERAPITNGKDSISEPAAPQAA